MLENFEKLISIKIPEYIREVTVSNAQRPRYFEWNGTTIKAKGKKLWKKCIKDIYYDKIELNEGNVLPQYLEDKYRIALFHGDRIREIYQNEGFPNLCQAFLLTDKQLKKRKKYYLIELESLEKVVSNPTQVGTPNNEVITGQKIYDGNYNEFTRAKIVNALHKMYEDKFNSIPDNKLRALTDLLNSNYPLWFCLELRDTVNAWNDKTKKGNGRRWDVPSRTFPYLKTFADFLTNNNYIEDDDRLHLLGDGSFFTPVTRDEYRELIFHIYKDKRRFWETIINATKNE